MDVVIIIQHYSFDYVGMYIAAGESVLPGRPCMSTYEFQCCYAVAGHYLKLIGIKPMTLTDKT